MSQPGHQRKYTRNDFMLVAKIIKILIYKQKSDSTVWKTLDKL